MLASPVGTGMIHPPNPVFGATIEKRAVCHARRAIRKKDISSWYMMLKLNLCESAIRYGAGLFLSARVWPTSATLEEFSKQGHDKPNGKVCVPLLIKLVDDVQCHVDGFNVVLEEMFIVHTTRFKQLSNWSLSSPSTKCVQARCYIPKNSPKEFSTAIRGNVDLVALF